MYFKKLIGKKCYLSPIDVNDVPIYTAWLNDSEVNANLTLASSVISLETEKEFLQTLDDMSEKAFDDQCTTANPRYPLVREIRELYLKCYYGKDYRPTSPELAKSIGVKIQNKNTK